MGILAIILISSVKTLFCNALERMPFTETYIHMCVEIFYACQDLNEGPYAELDVLRFFTAVFCI